MELLDKVLILKYITGKQAEYRKRRDKAKDSGDAYLSGDYELKIMLLDNWLLRINKGEFNAYSVKEPDIVSEGESNA